MTLKTSLETRPLLVPELMYEIIGMLPSPGRLLASRKKEFAQCTIVLLCEQFAQSFGDLKGLFQIHRRCGF